MAQQGTPVLQVQDVAIKYGGTVVVSGASFEVEDGEFVTLLGPSGSGKTSLLRTIAGFVPASSGRILLRGQSMEGVPAYRRDIGLVFQNYGLFPHMTVEQNLSFGPRLMKLAQADIDERVRESLVQVRLDPFRRRYPHELSGGQQQRVAIARALAMRPSLLLLDEPMSNLDARLRAEMRVELVEMLKRLGVTAVAVTHNQEEALGMSDRVVVMAEGGIRQVGTPKDVYARPADTFVANFVGDANVMEASYVGASTEGGSLFRTDGGMWIAAAAPAASSAAPKKILIRPESITLAPSGVPAAPPTANQATGRIVSTSYMGAFTEVRASVGEQSLLVRLAPQAEGSEWHPGDQVLLRWDVDAVRTLAQ